MPHLVASDKASNVIEWIKHAFRYVRGILLCNRERFGVEEVKFLVAVPESVFVQTDARPSVGKIGERDMEMISNMLGTHRYYAPRKNDKPLLGLKNDNELNNLATFFCTHKRGVSYAFKSVRHGKGLGLLSFILTKQASR